MPHLPVPGPALRRRLRRPVAAALAVAVVGGVAASASARSTGAAAPRTTGGAAAPAAGGAAAGLRAAGTRAGAVTGALRARPPVPARTLTGASVTPARSAVRAGAPALRPAAARAAVAAAAPKPPAFVAVPGTDLVASASSSLAFAPDGSRVAYAASGRIWTSHPDGGSPVALFPAGDPGTRLDWEPNGFTLADAAGSPHVRSAANDNDIEDPAWLRGQHPGSASWAGSRLVLTLPAGSGGPRAGYAVYDPFSAKQAVETRYQVAAGTDDRVTHAAASPDGSSVAFVRTVTGTVSTEQLVVVDTKATSGGTVLGTSDRGFGRPVWSADAKTVYAPEASGGTSDPLALRAFPVDGSGPVLLSADVHATPYVYRRPKAAGPTYGVRFTGRDATATAIAASKDNWYAATEKQACAAWGAQAAVLVRANALEAVPAGPLAVAKCGPLLVTGSAKLDARVGTEVRRVLAKGRAVYLVGDTKALAPAVATALTKLGYKVVRYAGKTAYATAVDVAARGFRSHTSAFLASAGSPLDGIVATPIAGALAVPVLLTQGAKMNATTLAYIKKYKVGAWAVGAQAVTAAPWATRFAGSTTSDTSVRVADGFYWPIYAANVVSTTAVADALGAGAYAGSDDQPLLVTAPTAMPTSLRAYLDRNSASLDVTVVFGRATNPSAGVLTDAVRLGGGHL